MNIIKLNALHACTAKLNHLKTRRTSAGHIIAKSGWVPYEKEGSIAPVDPHLDPPMRPTILGLPIENMFTREPVSLSISGIF